MQRQRGFTLVELSIVLVVISLILGMAFKGRDLIYSAEIKAVQATSTKILAASNLYSERYGVNPRIAQMVKKISLIHCCMN